MTKCYYKNGQKNSDHEKLLEKSSDCTKEILVITKIITFLKSPQIFKIQRLLQKRWAILSRQLYKQKIPAIPPLLVNGKFVSDLCEKANLFNSNFASTFIPIKNSSVLPLAYFIKDQCQNNIVWFYGRRYIINNKNLRSS